MEELECSSCVASAGPLLQPPFADCCPTAVIPVVKPQVCALEKSLTISRSGVDLGIFTACFALVTSLTVLVHGSVPWTPIVVLLLGGMSAGLQEACAILRARDALIVAQWKEDVDAIVRRHDPNRVLFALLRVLGLAAFIAALVYLDVPTHGGFSAFFAFWWAFHSVRFAGIVRLNRYARSLAPRSVG
ncbi:membrane hypothetical protein [uncultured Defluviicoccus sp.]|uniref:Uncharacterized protein n=1 Tax=metagenome TaxID=256318 RepID=A0A380TCR4_9ZZZZ|nr:membrane hypothetical protein [uncultured Defluviicoccus sp.]